MGFEEKGNCSTGNPSPLKKQQQKWVLEGSRCLEQDSKGNSRTEAAGAVWNRRGLGPGARKR